MSKDVATRSVGTIDFSKGLSAEQVQLLKDSVCKNASDDELKLFIYQCEQRKLDPFVRQIHAVKRWNSDLKREAMTYQTGIDGYRLIASRTGNYAGQIGPNWCGKDGVWKEVWLDDKPPAAARVGVRRKGIQEPIWGVALWKEYAQVKQNGELVRMWASMGANQLAKCAEALALRKAFPEDLAGLHTDEELDQADNPQPTSKADDISGAIKAAQDSPAIETTARVVKPEVVKNLPATYNDELLDWVIPSVVKKHAGKRLGDLTFDEVQGAVLAVKSHFDKEHRQPSGNWLTFLNQAEKLLEKLMFPAGSPGDWEKETPSGTIGALPEPGSEG